MDKEQFLGYSPFKLQDILPLTIPKDAIATLHNRFAFLQYVYSQQFLLMVANWFFPVTVLASPVPSVDVERREITVSIWSTLTCKLINYYYYCRNNLKPARAPINSANDLTTGKNPSRNQQTFTLITFFPPSLLTLGHLSSLYFAIIMQILPIQLEY